MTARTPRRTATANGATEAVARAAVAYIAETENPEPDPVYRARLRDQLAERVHDFKNAQHSGPARSRPRWVGIVALAALVLVLVLGVGAGVIAMESAAPDAGVCQQRPSRGWGS